ncbi:MAG: hypothetical protein QM802_21130 [Agriterribacter sp.]
MKLKRSSVIMLVTIFVLVIVLYNKLHSEEDYQDDNTEAYSQDEKTEFTPSLIFRLIE